MTTTSVLFVCMGNICRSPMAEAVMRHLADAAGAGDRVTVDSAGTHAYHVGSAPHPETRAELERRGVDVGQQRARVVTAGDLAGFDQVVAMDGDNLADLLQLARSAPGSVRAELSLLLDHAEDVAVTDVPDPWYVGGFDEVYDLVEAGCRGLLTRVIGGS